MTHRTMSELSTSELRPAPLPKPSQKGAKINNNKKINNNNK